MRNAIKNWVRWLAGDGERWLRSAENPRVPLSAATLEDLGRSDPAKSGVRVNTDTALTYSPVWRAVTLISRDVAKLPLVVYRRTNGGKEPATTHPAYRLLKYKPSSEMTYFPFKQAVQADALTEGNGYAYIFRQGNGSPVELLRLSPTQTYPVREDGRLWYVTRVDEEFRRLDPGNVLHIKGMGDGLVGMSVVDKARESLGLGIAMQQHTAVFFKNSASPRVAIEVEGKMDDQAFQTLKKSWEAMYSGLDNAHKPAILQQGAKIHPFSISSEDAQLLESRQFEIREVANWFGVPPHKLGDTTRTTFASLYEENQSYLDEALDPWLVNWESEAWDKLLTEEEKQRDSHVVTFNRNAILRADPAARADYFNKATAGHPWMTVNEVRAKEDMNPADGFDDIKPPSNNFGGEGEAEDGGDGDGLGERQELVATAHHELLKDAARRAASRVGMQAVKAAGKPDQFIDWVDEQMEASHRDEVAEIVQPALRAHAAVSGGSEDAHAIATSFFEALRAVLHEATAATPEALRSKVRGLMDEFIDSYPRRMSEEVVQVQETR